MIFLTEVLPHPYFMDGESTYRYSPEINDHSVSISVGNYSKYVTACIRSATGCERYLDLKPQPPHGTWAKAALDRVDPLDGRDYSVCLSYSPNVDLRFTDFRDRCQEISLSASKLCVINRHCHFVFSSVHNCYSEKNGGY